MEKIITTHPISRGLRSFQKECEEGAKYFVKANYEHIATQSGIIQAPFYVEYQFGKPYAQCVPVHFMKENVFQIREGETGDLVGVVFQQRKLIALRVNWKHAIEIYYSNLVSIPDDKRILLGRFFDFTKVKKVKED